MKKNIEEITLNYAEKLVKDGKANFLDYRGMKNFGLIHNNTLYLYNYQKNEYVTTYLKFKQN